MRGAIRVNPGSISKSEELLFLEPTRQWRPGREISEIRGNARIPGSDEGA